ncbi:type II secretion system protein N [Wenzhouxiangella marina]|uniref:Uncharacterized protein n=1 Tax=Wenzhouxiangella marina TaxID=1579979 RepID=A0A0K0XX54_9GAMM|nr:type II secretion system protein N [Wenzhouxiangella marina]AKS42260.1 hypothetical protein WM2015_1894 [Wenzhouxiangella marina]MBB6085967.1 general secretion pathway protein C [Wenzhouxiangella marina]
MAQHLHTLDSGRVALFSTALLALAALWLLLRIVWLLLGGPEVQSAPVPPVPRISQASASSGEFRWQLFGQSRSLATPVRPVATVSRSSLRLVGVVSGDDGYAMISDSGREGVYRVGDELPDGSRLQSIETSQVILSANGRDEILALERDRLDTSPSRSAAAATPRTGGPNPIVANPMPGFRGFQAPTGISTASMPELTSMAGIDLSGMANNITVLPVNGGGFRVRPGRNARLFADLGLQVNDVVTAVNGQPLESEAQVQSLFADVLQRGEVTITINRQGREMVLRPDLDQILRSLQNQ